MTQICITIDVEGDSADNPHSTFLGIEEIIPKITELFSKYSINATLFIQEDHICPVGSIYADLWKSLENKGHEIGFHTHGLVGTASEKRCQIIANGIQRLKKLGFSPVSFRAGRYHFDSSMIKTLEENDIAYDSSVVPGLKECFEDGTVISDHTDAPHKPYVPSYENHQKPGDSKILEVPINRYPAFPADRWGGTLTGSCPNEEILFDYFFDIRKDPIIIITFHSWEGLPGFIKRLVRQTTYTKTNKWMYKKLYQMVRSRRNFTKNYFRQFDLLLSYISSKKDVRFTTINDAGKEAGVISGPR